MFLYRIASLNSATMADLWAYRIDDTKECKEFLKYHYDFDVEECHLGKWLICSKYAEWTCDTDVFPLNYRIQDISNIIPIDHEGVKTDFVAQACSESDPIQKITVDDVAKLRKELFKEKLDKAVQNIKLDVPSLHPTSTLNNCKEVGKWSETWPTSCHLDIRDMADMRKEKAKEKTTMKTTITLDIKKAIFNDPATIVIWADGTKTVVKCREGETYSKWAGLALCYAKRINGEKFHSAFKHWCKEDEETTEETGYFSGSAYSIADGFAEIGKNARICLETMAKAFNGDSSIDYRDVIFKDKSKAQSIIDDMNSVVHEFGNISLGNYCDMVGADHKLSDYYIGWTGTDKVGILTVKNGYKIILPEPGSIQPTVTANHVKNFNIESAIDEIKRTK